MASLSRRLQFVAAIGYGVLFALALTGAVRIACFLTGTPLSEHVAGNIFLITSLVAGSISGFVYVRSLKRPDSAPNSSLRPSWFLPPRSGNRRYAGVQRRSDRRKRSIVA